MTLQGLLRLDYLTNPYATMQTLYEPERYAPTTQVFDPRLQTYLPVPILDQAQLVECLMVCLFQGKPSHSSPVNTLSHRNQRNLPALVCVIPHYTKALVAAAEATPVQPIYRPDAPLTHYSEAWAKVWPWMSDAARAALRPHLDAYFDDASHEIIALIDEQAIPPINAHPSILSAWIKRGRPITTQDWHEALSLIHRTRGPVQASAMDLLLHFAPTEVLGDKGAPANPLHPHRSPLQSPMASPALVRHTIAISTESTSQHPCDYIKEWSSPLYATIILPSMDPTMQALTGRDLLQALSGYFHHDQLNIPMLRIEPTPAVLQMLHDEQEGPYADVATLIARHIPDLERQPDAVRRLAHSPIPCTLKDLHRVLDDPNLSLANLARCLREIIPWSDPFPDLSTRLAQHPAATRDFIHRCLHHDDHRIVSAAASSTLLTEDEDRVLLARQDVNINQSVYTKYLQMPMWMIEHIMERQTVQGFLALCRQRHLPTSCVQAIMVNPSFTMIEQLAQGDNFTLDDLRVLETAEDPRCRAIAGRYGDASMCARLSRERTHLVTAAVAENPHASRDTVECLAKRHRKRLASILVQHPNLSNQTRISLSLLLSS